MWPLRILGIAVPARICIVLPVLIVLQLDVVVPSGDAESDIDDAIGRFVGEVYGPTPSVDGSYV